MDMKKARLLIASFLALGVLTFLWRFAPDVLDQRSADGVAYQPQPVDQTCHVQDQGCRIELPGVGHVLVTMPKEIIPLERFEFTVFAEPGVAQQVGEIVADFDMIEMDMGVNRYTLTRDASDVYSQTVVLPICTATVTDWIASLFVTTTAGHYRYEFDFVMQPPR